MPSGAVMAVRKPAKKQGASASAPPDFQEAIADFYDGALHVVNFLAQPDDAVKTINRWVSDKTGARIKELLNRDFINEDTRLILTNAICFKARWENVFDKA